jgi:hypothetical protein
MSTERGDAGRRRGQEKRQELYAAGVKGAGRNRAIGASICRNDTRMPLSWTVISSHKIVKHFASASHYSSGELVSPRPAYPGLEQANIAQKASPLY